MRHNGAAIVLMGGTSSIVAPQGSLDDTWEFATFGGATSVGVGCPGSWGVPDLDLCSGTSPAIGQDLCLELTGGPPAAPGPLVFLGGGVLPAPLPLDPIGAPDCSLHVQPTAVTVFTSNTGNTWQWSVPIPNDPSLLGAGLGAQGVAPDPVNVLGLTFTNGLEIFVGSR